MLNKEVNSLLQEAITDLLLLSTKEKDTLDYYKDGIVVCDTLEHIIKGVKENLIEEVQEKFPEVFFKR